MHYCGVKRKQSSRSPSEVGTGFSEQGFKAQLWFYLPCPFVISINSWFGAMWIAWCDLCSLFFPSGLGTAFSHYLFVEKCLSWQIICEKAPSWNYLSFSCGSRKCLTVSFPLLIFESFFSLMVVHSSSGCPAVLVVHILDGAAKNQSWIKILDVGVKKGVHSFSSGSMTARRTKSACFHMVGLMLAVACALIHISRHLLHCLKTRVAWLGECATPYGKRHCAFTQIWVFSLWHFGARTWLP